MSYTNPDAPNGGSWLANTYEPLQQVQTVHTVGGGNFMPTFSNPYANGSSSSRSMGAYNPAYQPGQQQIVPVTGNNEPMKPFSVYPGGSSTNLMNTSSLNAVAIQQNQQQPNLWANLPGYAPAQQQPQQNGNIQTAPTSYHVQPTINSYDGLFNSAGAWNKKDGQPWQNTVKDFTLSSPSIDWQSYNNNNGNNGCYAPQGANNPQFPMQFNTTPINNDWNMVCETNFALGA